MSPYIGYDSEAFFPRSLNSDLTITGGGVTQTGGDVNFDSGTLFIDEDLNRVGIGTSNPLGKLHTFIDANSELLFQSVSQNNLYISGTNASLVLDSKDSMYPGVIIKTQGILNGILTNIDGQNLNSGVGLTNASGNGLVINSTGNVGIGTTNPQQKLSIYGNVQINNTGKALYLNAYPGIQDNTVSFEAIRSDFTTGASVLEISTKDNNNSLVRRFRITDVGNVSISSTITVPNTRLEVSESNSVNQPAISSGASATSGSFSFATRHSGENADYIANILSTNHSTGRSVYGHGVRGARENETAIVPSTSGFVSTFDNFSGHRTAITQHTDGFIRFFNSGSLLQTTVGSEVVMSERLTIGATGNVGIGTTNPAKSLHATGEVQFSTNTKTHITHLFTTGGVDDGKYIIKNASNAEKIILDTNGLTYFTGGNVGIGIDSSNNGDMTLNDPRLHVLYSTNTTGSYDLVARFQSGGDANYTGGAILINHVNDRGLLLEGGRGLDNTAIAHLGLVDNTGVNSRVVTLYNNNVGIGTTNPSEKLEVNGNLLVGSPIYANTSSPVIRLGHQAGNFADGTIRGTIQFDSIQDYSVNTGDSWRWKIATVARPGASGNYNSQFEILRSTRAGVTDNTDFCITRNGGVGIGTTNPGYKLEVNGSFAATTKSFIIPHPTKPGYKLRHGSLEGPENGVYVRGRSHNSVIHLPDYWVALVDPDSITVSLTPVGPSGVPRVERIENNKVYVFTEDSRPLEYFYMVNAERVDVEPLEVEISPTN